LSNHSIKTFLEYKDKPSVLFEKLLEIWREEISNKEKKTTRIIIQLNKECGIDFCESGLRAIDEGINCFDIFHVLENAIPYLILDVSATIAFLQKINKCMESDLASGLQYAPIKKLVNTQPDFAKKLLKKLLELNDTFIVGYISAIFEEFSKDNLVEIHAKLVSLIESNSESEYVLQAIIIALGNLYYQPDSTQSLIKKTINIFDKFINKSNADIKATLVIALGSLMKFTDDVFDRLFKLSCIELPQIKFQVSRVLFTYFDEINHNQWFVKILMQLSNIKCEYKGIIDNLDYILLKIVREKKDYTLTEEFFTKWLLVSDYGNTAHKLEDLFNSLLAEFINNEEFLSGLITKYFNHENSKLHLAASEIIRYCNLHRKSQLKLNSDILKQFSFDDLKYICRKILGYLYEPITLCSLIFSIYESNPENKDIKSLIFPIFIDILGKDYSGTVLKFLEEKLTEYNQFENTKNFINSISESIKKKHEQLNSLTRLKEFLLPRKFAYQISLEENKKMNIIMEQAQKNSIVNLIATKIPLKYGKGWFGYVNGKYMTPSKLTSFSHAVELPRSEMTHPVSAALRRFGFRLAKRDES